MAWMVALVLIMFYVVGRSAFHETALIGSLPYVAAAVVILDFVLAFWLKRAGAARINRSTQIVPARSAGGAAPGVQRVAGGAADIHRPGEEMHDDIAAAQNRDS